MANRSHCTARLLILVASAALPASAAPAAEWTAAGPAPEVVIYDAETTLRQFCRSENGVLWLHLPNGSRHELVQSTSDPAIANPGDGFFHPFTAAEVRAALAGLRFPLERVRVAVFILPFPRRASLSSASGAGHILLTPSVRPRTRQQQHSEITHEFGHAVQRAILPDWDAAGWRRYLEVRGVAAADEPAAGGAHGSPRHELFAEDFRTLFGGELAQDAGDTAADGPPPARSVPGLEAFLLGLLDVERAGAEVRGFPNPTRAGVCFALARGPESPLDLFDARGRRVATVAPLPAPWGIEWRWNGADEAGFAVAPGIYFARPRGGGGTARITVLR